MRKSCYIIFVSRDDDGRLRKIPVPLRYAYIFVAAALVGLFTITGLAGSYSRMLLKTASFNQIRSDRESLRKDYLQMEQVAHEKDVQAASLGSLADEISALYGLRQSRLAKASAARNAISTPVSNDGMSDQQYYRSLNQFVALRSSAMSERSRGSLISRPVSRWVRSAPSIWPTRLQYGRCKAP